MRREGSTPKGLQRWLVALVGLLGGSVVMYVLVCLFLAASLWFNPIAF